MLKRLLAAALLATGVAFAVGALHTRGASAASTQTEGSSSSAPPPIPSYLLAQTAVQVAQEQGDITEPSKIEEVSGTLGQAAELVDPKNPAPTVIDPRTGKPWSESPVDVVTMKGAFTYNGPMPYWASTTKGNTLTFVVDLKSGIVVSQVISDATPDLAQISPTVTAIGG